MNLSKIYKPLTATQSSISYNGTVEIPPCKLLEPYISCFWGTMDNHITKVSDVITHTLVIPDTCMDIIIDVNYTDNTISDMFSGLSDKSFLASSKAIKAKTCTFAIRFYAWAVILFADNDMSHVLNNFSDVECYFNTFKKEIEERLLDCETISERIDITQRYLLGKLNKSRQNSNVMNAIYYMLRNYGNIRVKDLCRDLAISERQIERLFKLNIGTSPKSLSNMIRYQYLFADIIYHDNFDIHEAVLKYNYSDQSHLISSFKKYHTMTPVEAKKHAFNYL